MSYSDRMQSLRALMAKEHETVALLENWGRWSVERSVPRTCASIEKLYRPERGDQAERRTPKLEVDVNEALKTWRAVSPHYGFPLNFALLLTAYFALQLREESLIGYMRRHKKPVQFSTWPSEMERAILAARNRLKIGALVAR